MATQVTTGLLANNAVTDAKLSATITATTQSASDNSTNVATTAYVTTAIANLADSAPDTLNTLNELAAALGDDANFSTTVTNSIATKLPLAGGSLTGGLTITASGDNLKLKRSGFDDFNFGMGTGNSQSGFHITNTTDSTVPISIHENAPASTLVIDSSGNIGIAAIPAGEAAAAHVIRLGDRVCIGEYDDGSNPEQFNLFHNSDSSETYIEAGAASAIQQRSGALTFKNALEGNAGAAITFTERMHIAASGLVGIGTTSPQTQLHVSGTNNSAGDLYTAVGAGNVPSITIQNAGTTDNNNAGLFFRDNDGMVASVAARFVSHTSGDEKTQLRFSVTGSGNTREKMVLTEDGHLGIGTVTPDYDLSVSGTGGTRIMVENTDTNWAALDVRAGGNQANYVFFKDDSAERARMTVYDSEDIAFSTGNSPDEKFRITQQGYVKIPDNPHWHGSITNTSGSGFANSATAQNSRNTINYVSSGGYIRFVAPTAGVYILAFTSIADNGTGRVDSSIRINGTTISNQLSSNNGSGYRQRTGVVIVTLAESDQVTVSNDDWYSATGTGYENWRTFSMAMIA